MGILLAKLKSFRQAVSAVARDSATVKKFNQLAETKPDIIAAAIAVEDAKLRPTIKQMIIANYKASGIGSITGTMARAMDGVLVDLSRNNIFIHMPSGIAYPKNKGNPYAAAGVFRYGGIRQPRTETHYKDLPTGEIRLRKKKGGIYGQKVKAAVKRVALRGGVLTEREAKGKSGRALKDLHAGVISLMKPRPPFFQLSDAQRQKLLELRYVGVKAVFKRFGLESA